MFTAIRKGLSPGGIDNTWLLEGRPVDVQHVEEDKRGDYDKQEGTEPAEV